MAATDQAQYAIDIAAKLTSGDATLDQLDELTALLSAGGKDADYFGDAVKRVSADLDAATASSKAANEALSDGQTRYSELEKAANKAALAAEKAALKTKDVIPEGLAERAEAANAALAAGKSRYNELRVAAEKAATAADAFASSNGGASDANLVAQAVAATDALDREGAAVRKLSKEAKGLAADMKNLTSVGNLQAQAEAAKAAVDAEAGALRKLETAAEDAAKQQRNAASVAQNLGKVQTHTTRRLEQSASKASKLAGAMGDLGGPLGKVGQSFIMPVKGAIEMTQVLGKATTVALVAGVAIAAVTVAVIAVGVAFVAGVASVTKWGVSLADAARTASENDRQLGLLHKNLDGYSAAAKDAADATGLSDDALKGLAVKLSDANVSAADLPAALKSAAMAETALGKGGADKFVKDVKAGVTTVKQFEKAANSAFGGSVQRRMLGLDAQSKKLGSNIGEVFGGLDIEPLLEGLSTLVALFDENTVAGETMKFLFEEIFQPIVDGVTAAIPLIEAFFIGMLIGAVKTYIALKPTIKALKDFFGFDDETTAETFDAVAEAGELVAYAVAGLVAGFVGLAVVVAPVVAALVLVVAALALVGVAIGAVVAASVYAGVKFWQFVGAVVDAAPVAYQAVKDGIGQAVDWLMNLSLVKTGKNIIMGLVDGIRDGISAVKNVMASVADAVLGTTDKALEIHSPSKALYERGEDTADGFENAVVDATPGVQASMAGMVDPPSVGRAAHPLRSAGLVDGQYTGAGGASNNAGKQAASTTQATGNVLENVTFNFGPRDDAADIESRVRQVLMQFMQGTLTQTGGASA